MKPCEADVDDAVQLQAREDFALDRFRRQHHPALGAAELVADRVGGVDLFFGIALAVPGLDVDHQIARDRQHRGLALFGVEAHQQDRVASAAGSSRSAASLEPTRRSEPRIRKVCGPPLYSAVTTPLGALISLSFGNTSSAMVGDLVERERGGGAAAEQHDQDAREHEAFEHAPAQRRRALVVLGGQGIAAHVAGEGRCGGGCRVRFRSTPRRPKPSGSPGRPAPGGEVRSQAC